MRGTFKGFWKRVNLNKKGDLVTVFPLIQKLNLLQ